MIRVLCLGVVLGLAACAHQPVTTVEVPVPVKCAPHLSTYHYPDTPKAIKAQKNIFGRVKLLLAGRKERDARILELKAALDGCSS